MKKVCDI